MIPGRNHDDDRRGGPMRGGGDRDHRGERDNRGGDRRDGRRGGGHHNPRH